MHAVASEEVSIHAIRKYTRTSPFWEFRREELNDCHELGQGK